MFSTRLDAFSVSGREFIRGRWLMTMNGFTARYTKPAEAG
jgi:hypothetical protein